MENPFLDSFRFKNLILDVLKEMHPKAQEKPVLNLKYNWDGRDKYMYVLYYSKQSHHLRRAHAFWASCDQAPDALNEIKNQT